MPGSGTGGFHLLMVDDSEEDAVFVRRALEGSGVGQSFHWVHDGQEAIAYLRAEGEYADRARFPFPTILLTDLKMPGMDGFALLRWLHSHPACDVIPAVMFSSSWIENDVIQAYRLGANGFFTKPSTYEELVDLIQITFKFWSRCQVPIVPTEHRCD